MTHVSGADQTEPDATVAIYEVHVATRFDPHNGRTDQPGY